MISFSRVKIGPDDILVNEGSVKLTDGLELEKQNRCGKDFLNTGGETEKDP